MPKSLPHSSLPSLSCLPYFDCTEPEFSFTNSDSVELSELSPSLNQDDNPLAIVEFRSINVDYLKEWQDEQDFKRLIEAGRSFSQILKLLSEDPGLDAEVQFEELAAEVKKKKKKSPRTRLEMEQHRLGSLQTLPLSPRVRRKTRRVNEGSTESLTGNISTKTRNRFASVTSS
ncbi:unnamed protein product [Linum trigynum]|uniref:Uncharacterized protein n=1 Tax=Linum trigynum TaxID=586398 RepID=A0AAV2D987_9ROSI